MPFYSALIATSLLAAVLTLQAASWTKLKNPAPGFIIWPILLLSDGTIMVLSDNDYQTWYRYTPDALGNYANGDWKQAPQSKMITPRLDFASQLLPSGKVWVMGGEWDGPTHENDGYQAEIFDPLTNTWTAAAPFPNMPGCGIYSSFLGQITSGSPVMTGIESTAGWQVGWPITLAGGITMLPAGTTITSIDSATQVHLSANATATTVITYSLSPQIVGNIVAGSHVITGISSTTGILPGFGVTGPGIPSGAQVTAVTSSSITLQASASTTETGVTLTLAAYLPKSSCAGDMISILLPGDKVLTGSLVNNNTYLYDPVADSWAVAAPLAYPYSTDEDGWARLADGTIVDYNTFASLEKNAGYAQRYDPVANRWSPISPADGTAKGILPLLTGFSAGEELGATVRLQDDRAFVIGANGHTALYTPSTNTWAAGPDMMGILGGQPFLFAADDAPAAVLPNGHVLLAGDAGLGVATTGSTTNGSPIVVGIPSTAQLFAGWAASGPGISGSTIKSVDSATQVTLSASATATGSGVAIQFGGTYTQPTQLFDFDPVANTMTPLPHGASDPAVSPVGSFTTQMLMLPTGQVLYSEGNLASAFWIYTPDGAAAPSLLPAIQSIVPKGNGVSTLTGTQLNGQSAGAAYGDDEQNDTSFPTISMTSASGNVYYARSMNWSYIGIAGGSTPQTVDFTMNSQVTSGTYSLVVSGAGLQSPPVRVTVAAGSGGATITQLPSPAVGGVNDAPTFRTSIVPGAFAAIYGQNLAATTRTWAPPDFTGGVVAGSPLPTTLDGVSVTIGGLPAAVYFVSPSQLSVQVPTLPSGPASVVVTSYDGFVTAAFTTQIVQMNPAFFNYAGGSNLYPAAEHLNQTLVGDPSVSSGTPAHAGEILALYVSALGASPAGTIVPVSTFTPPVTVSAGSWNLQVLGAALVSAGEYQVNVQLPADIPTGNYPMSMTVPGGSTSNSGVTTLLVVANP